MKFIGREEEVRKIKDLYQSPGMEVLLLYGRRRIGKSELMKHSMQFFEGKRIYYECKQTSEMNNVESLATLLSEEFGYPKISFSGLEEVLDFLFKKATEENILLILDEYSYLSDVLKGMDSVLQSLIDKYRNRSKLKLALCGSFVDTMQRLIEKENPLFGRFDLVLKLKPMDYYDSAQFYSHFPVLHRGMQSTL